MSVLYWCSECGKTFKTSAGRVRHAEVCKPAACDKFQGYYCYDCGLRFPHGDTFTRHIEIRHGVAVSGQENDGRMGRKPGTVEIIRNVDDGPAVRVVYRNDV